MFKLIVDALIGMINIIPDASGGLRIPVAETLAWFAQLLYTVNYVLPIGELIKMFVVVVVVYNFAIVWKLVFRVWDALPFT